MSKSYIHDYVGTTICFSASLIFLAATASIIPNSSLKNLCYVWIIVVTITLFFVLKSLFLAKKGDATEGDNNKHEIEVSSPLKKLSFYDNYFWIVFLVLFPIFICSLIGGEQQQK